MSPFVRAVAIGVLVGGCAAPPTAESESSQVAPASPIADPALLDATLDQYIDRKALPFIYARLEDRDGNLLYEHSAVNTDLLPGVTIDGDSWIRIWSMSKAVTIAIALDLEEDGILSLDDPVIDYIPEFADLRVAVDSEGGNVIQAADREAACPLVTKPVRSTMTVRHLINHEAGFYYAVGDSSCLDEAFAMQTVMSAADSNELIARLAEMPLVQQPGSVYHYGMNTTVLGLVAERASGKSLAELLNDRVATPLGVTGLRYDKPDGVTLQPRFSGADGDLRRAHEGELDILGGGVPDYDPQHPLYLGGEGMLGTPDAYADFLRMLLNYGQTDRGRILDAATVEEMVAPHTQVDSNWGHNGYNVWVSSGKMVGGTYGRGGLWQVGGYEGTHGWVDPELGIVGVVVTQVHAASDFANQRHDVFREAVYDQLLPERQATEYKLYYLGGQSNMDGFGWNTDLPPDLAESPQRTLIYRGQSAGDGSERGGVGRWEPLGPGFGLGFRTNGVQSWRSDRFGPELTFGHRMVALDPDARTAIIKYSRGGTPLYRHGSGYGTWNPDVPGLNQYDFALRSIREATAERDIDGDGVPDRLVPAGIVWMQGEADAFDSEAAALAYEDNLKRMIGLFRAALGVDDLPVVIGQITDSGMAEDGTVMDWSEEVRAAQQRYVDADSCAALVTVTNDFDYPDDDPWHYTSPGYLRMGTAFADAVVTLEEFCAQ